MPDDRNARPEDSASGGTDKQEQDSSRGTGSSEDKQKTRDTGSASRSGDEKGKDSSSPDDGKSGKSDGSISPKNAAAGESAKPGEDGGPDGGPGPKDGAKGAAKGSASPLKGDGGKDGPLAKMKKLLKRIKMALKAAMTALKAFIVMKIFMAMKMLMMMLMGMLTAMVQAVVAAVMAVINAIATALGVAAAVAATILTGGIALLAAIVVVVVVAVVSDQAAQRDGLAPDCNVDTEFMEVHEKVSVEAWTNAKIIYTFFKSYGKASGAEYSDEMIAGILGNWHLESVGVDTTAVETIFDEPHGTGPKKRWLQDGYVQANYKTTREYVTCGGCSAEGCHCTGWWVTKYAGTDLTAVWKDGSACNVFLGEGESYPVTYADGGSIGDVLESESCSCCGASTPISTNEPTIGQAYGRDAAGMVGPMMFRTRQIDGIYHSGVTDSTTRRGIGLGQWTDTGYDAEGEPTGRSSALLKYAAKHSGIELETLEDWGKIDSAWHHVDLQLMYALADDGRKDLLQNWTDMSTDAMDKWYGKAFVDTHGRSYSAPYMAADGTVYDFPEVSRVAYCTEQFLLHWEGCDNGTQDKRIEYALMWYDIISNWNENYDYTVGTGGSLWGLVAADAGIASDLTQSSYIRSCADLKFFGNSTLAEAAVSYAWGPGKSYANNGTRCWQHLFFTMKPNDPHPRCCDRTVALAVKWTGTDSAFEWGGTTAQLKYLNRKSTAYKAMMQTGDYEETGVGFLGMGTLTDNTAWWEEIECTWNGNLDDYLRQLRPGDILIRNDSVNDPCNGGSKDGVGHIVMYVGQEVISRRWPELSKDEEGNPNHGYCVVSGSIDEYSPHIQKFTTSGRQSSQLQTYHVFRNRGTWCSDSARKYINLNCVGYSNDAA